MVLLGAVWCMVLGESSVLLLEGNGGDLAKPGPWPRAKKAGFSVWFFRRGLLSLLYGFVRLGLVYGRP